MEESQSDSFRINFQCWKVFGIWPGKLPSKTYKYYSFFYLFLFLFIYNVLLTINLLYTPLKVDLIIKEVMFYFNEISIMVKVGTIILFRKKIFAIFDILDCELFKGNDKVGQETIKKATYIYKICWKLYASLCNLCFFFGPCLSVLLYLLSFNNDIELPVSKYHFLNTETRKHYFGYLHAYQFIGIFGHMMYNLNIDSFFAGLLFYAIIQIKILGRKLKNLNWKIRHVKFAHERARINELNYCLRHYESILKYCAGVQEVLGFALFVQFGMASAIICAVSCALFLPDAKVVYITTYLTGMTLQIFVPAWLGNQLLSESQHLVFAAYSGKWVSECRPYKSSFKLFMARANTPIVMTGMKLFKLNLETFLAIMKTAYSFVTLVRNVQERN